LFTTRRRLVSQKSADLIPGYTPTHRLEKQRSGDVRSEALDGGENYLVFCITSMCSLVCVWKCFARTCAVHLQGRLEPSWEVTGYIEVGVGLVWLIRERDGESETGPERATAGRQQ
jgi:hypothetical protein